MIQTKEELFLAELGINTKEEIELAYGAKIKITDLLKKYEAKQLLIHSVVGRSEQYCECEAPLIRTGTGGDDQEYCGICELDIK